MEISGNMDTPVRTSIKHHTPTAVAREMGLPISTIHRWMEEDRIPGQGAAHQWRKEQFEAAIAKLRGKAAVAAKRKRAA